MSEYNEKHSIFNGLAKTRQIEALESRIKTLEEALKFIEGAAKSENESVAVTYRQTMKDIEATAHHALTSQE